MKYSTSSYESHSMWNDCVGRGMKKKQHKYCEWIAAMDIKLCMLLCVLYFEIFK